MSEHHFITELPLPLPHSMASLQARPVCLRFHRTPSLLPRRRLVNLRFPRSSFSVRSRRFPLRARRAADFLSVCCVANTDTEIDVQRPPFDINLAVILAGFAFEAYTTPPENAWRREVDAADCQTVYLSESFVREIYDGQLFVKLKKGLNLPAMDPWGTSDPYVVMELDGQVAKSKVKWG